MKELEHFALANKNHQILCRKFKIDFRNSNLIRANNNSWNYTTLITLCTKGTSNLTCPDMRRELQIYNKSHELFELLHKYAKENLLWLNVYVKDSFATRIIRDERMTRTSFVANVGGLLGLCMGFSLVSVAEILYFCLKRNVKKHLETRKSKWEISSAQKS